MRATVSVVIPTYNRPEFLRDAIETALSQTYNEIVVYVVDDGSDEPYANQIVAKFSDDVRCIQHKKNKGLSAARNTGIQKSSGEYVAFLDDDDRWHSDKITRQVQALERDETAGLATCLIGAITPDNELIHCETTAPSGDCADSMLMGNQVGTPSRVVVRRKCFDDIGTFDESLQTKQDWDFYLRLCQEWSIVAVNDHLCFRTVHKSMSSSPEAAKRDNRAIVEKHEDLIKSRNCWKKSQAEIAERVGRAHLSNGNLQKARKEFRESIQREATSQRGVLYLLTFTHPVLVDKLRQIKRKWTVENSSCSKSTITKEALSMKGK